MDITRVKLEAERAFFNHVLLSKPHATLNPAKKMQRDVCSIYTLLMPYN